MTSCLVPLSRALDTGKIGEVFVALQTIGDEQEGRCEDAFARILHEFISWDLSVDVESSEVVVRHLLSLLKTPELLQEQCVHILMTQPDVAVPIAVEMMIAENWKLSHSDCKDVWEKIEATKPKTEQKSSEYTKRVTANSQILRISGASRRLLKSFLLDILVLLNHQKLPEEFLNELATLAPFHPLLELTDLKNSSKSFLLPRVISPAHRFHAAVDEFIQFLRNGYRMEDATSMFAVLRGICEQMEHIEMLGSEDIDRMVNFWMYSIRIFDGPGIDMSHLTTAAKLIEKCAACFDVRSRPLFLKHFVRRLAEQKTGQIAVEPQIVAVIITTYKQHMTSLNSPEFYNELGDFWTLCYRLKYDDVHNATVYFSSLFTLAQAQALFRVKKPLCRAVYEKILKPIHEQIVDFKRMKSVEKGVPEMQLGEEVFDIMIYTYQLAEEAILKFIN